MSAPAPLRHYYVAPDDGRAATCLHGLGVGGACSRPESDPVHLTPGDDAAWTAAVTASTAGHNAHKPDPAIREPARKRHAARWTFGTATTSADADDTVTANLGDPARGPSASG